MTQRGAEADGKCSDAGNLSFLLLSLLVSIKEYVDKVFIHVQQTKLIRLFVAQVSCYIIYYVIFIILSAFLLCFNLFIFSKIHILNH